MVCVLCYRQIRCISRRVLKSRLVEATSAISDARRVLDWQQSLHLFASYMNAAHTEQLLVEMPIFNAAMTETWRAVQPKRLVWRNAGPVQHFPAFGHPIEACEVGSRWAEAMLTHLNPKQHVRFTGLCVRSRCNMV